MTSRDGAPASASGKYRVFGDTLELSGSSGRALMMQDLGAIHDVTLEAYKALMLLGATDLDALAKEPSHFLRCI